MSKISKKLTDCEKVEIVKKYETDNFSMTQLAKEYGVSLQSISRFLKRRKIPLSKSAYDSRRKYTLNESYFDVIDVEEKAYFLGLLYADGYNNHEKGCIALSLQEEDKEILEKLNLLIESDRPLFHINERYKNTLHKNSYVLNVSSRHMSDRLNELGCTQAKSLILKFPTEEQVPSHLIRHFIRGYFDGDGCYTISTPKTRTTPQSSASIVSTEDFCISVGRIIDRFLHLNYKITKRFKDSETSTRSIVISGNHQAYKFIKWLFSNATIYLKRKFNKFKEIENILFTRDLIESSRVEDICLKLNIEYTENIKNIKNINILQNSVKFCYKIYYELKPVLFSLQDAVQFIYNDFTNTSNEVLYDKHGDELKDFVNLCQILGLKYGILI